MFALHAGIAIENARLHEQVQRLAVVEERERIGKDLHDGDHPGDLCRRPVARGRARADGRRAGRGAAPASTGRSTASTTTIRDIRNFIFGLRPALLDGRRPGGRPRAPGRRVPGQRDDRRRAPSRADASRRPVIGRTGRVAAARDRPRGAQQRRPPLGRHAGRDLVELGRRGSTGVVLVDRRQRHRASIRRRRSRHRATRACANMRDRADRPSAARSLIESQPGAGHAYHRPGARRPDRGRDAGDSSGSAPRPMTAIRRQRHATSTARAASPAPARGRRPRGRPPGPRRAARPARALPGRRRGRHRRRVDRAGPPLPARHRGHGRPPAGRLRDRGLPRDPRRAARRPGS